MLTFSTGVFPTGAQVRLTSGASRKPDSWIKTISACVWCAFFNLRPALFAPLADRLLIPLAGAVFWLLRTETQLEVQDLPHVVGVVVNPEVLLDESLDPRTGPQVGVKAARPGALQKEFAQPLVLLVR